MILPAMPSRLSFRLAPLLLLLALAGVSLPAAAPADKPTARASLYRLHPMDLIKVQVFQEPDLDRELRVSRDHTIVVPLVGVVDVRNLTVRDAELLLTELYQRDFLVNPQINITVAEYSPRAVNVLGAVANPGSVVIPPEKDLTLLDAVARSGGFNRFANRAKVSLTRTIASGQTENYTINADDLVSGDNNDRWLIRDGDIIYVPERVL